MIHPADLRALALDLLALPGPPGGEGAIAAFVRGYLERRGISVSENGRPSGGAGEPGNLLAFIPGSSQLPALLFAAHLDTTAHPAKPLWRHGCLAGPPGGFAADDRLGVALVLALANSLPPNHGPIELLFTVAEESGLRGARRLDPRSLSAAAGFVLDSPGVPGEIIAQGMGAVELELRLESAAQTSPSGRRGVRLAAELLAKLPRSQDQADWEFHLWRSCLRENSLRIGGVVYGRTRRDLDTALEELGNTFAESAASHGFTCLMRQARSYPAYRLKETSPPLVLAVTAAREAGLNPVLVGARHGSDANILNAKGLPTVNLAAGWRESPAGDLWADPVDLERMVSYLGKIVEIARISVEMGAPMS